jgi:hypothetical protein
MKVSPIKLKDSKGYSLSLTIDRIYEVLGIEADTYRVLTDPESKPYGNDPVLYAPDCFKIVDPQEPDFWICQYGEDGERYCYPSEWNEVGFFEMNDFAWYIIVALALANWWLYVSVVLPKVRKNRRIYLRDWGVGIGAPFKTLIEYKGLCERDNEPLFWFNVQVFLIAAFISFLAFYQFWYFEL